MGGMRHRQECSKYEQGRENNQQTAMGKIRHFGTPSFYCTPKNGTLFRVWAGTFSKRHVCAVTDFCQCSLLPGASRWFTPAASNHRVTAAGIKKRHWTLNGPCDGSFR